MSVLGSKREAMDPAVRYLGAKYCNRDFLESRRELRHMLLAGSFLGLDLVLGRILFLAWREFVFTGYDCRLDRGSIYGGTLCCFNDFRLSCRWSVRGDVRSS